MAEDSISIKYIYEIAKIKKDMDIHFKDTSLQAVCKVEPKLTC